MVLWQVIFWGILTVVLIGAEIATVQLISVWFGAGALVAFVSSLFNVPFFVQFILFIAVSSILLLATRPIAKKFLDKDHVKTNSDSLVGRECVVQTEVSNIQGGRVLVDSLDWSAKCATPDAIYKAGTVCVIEEIQGVTLVVRAK